MQQKNDSATLSTEFQLLQLSLQTLMPDAASRPLTPFKVQLYPCTVHMQEEDMCQWEKVQKRDSSLPMSEGTEVQMITHCL